MEYGVGITNRYAFLNDDVDDEDVAIAVPVPVAVVVQVQAGSKDKKKLVDKKPVAVKNTKKPVVDKKIKTTPAINDGDDWGDPVIEEPLPYQQQVPSRDIGVSSRGRGGGRGSGRGGGYTRQTDFDRNNGFDNGGANGMDKRYGNVGDNMMEQPQHRDFGNNRGRGGGRGSGRGGGFTRRRDFDRLSGSDKGSVKPMDKRDGAGAHNWGTYKEDDMTYNNEPESGFYDAVKDDVGVENGQGDAELNGNGMNGELGTDETQVTVTEPKVEEPKLLTLEQWKAMQEPKSTPNFNIRKPNEGEDPSKWKNLVLKKKENLDDEDELIYEIDDIWVPQRAGRLKRITDIGFHFVDDRDEQRTFRRGGHMGSKPMRELVADGGGDGYDGGSSGYGGFGRGNSRGTSRGGYRRERPPPGQGQRGKSQDVPRVDDTKEWPSLMC